MPFAAPQTTTRRLALALVAVLAALGWVTVAPPSAHAAPAGWGRFVITDPTASRNYVGTMTQQVEGFPAATFRSNSVGGSSVGVQSGTSTYLSAATPVGAKYGSSEGQGYLNLRPNSQNGAPPSVTTYTFERPTPTSGWTFVLGDVDADQVTITATGPGGRTVALSELGFRSVFNYCTPPVCTANTDVPTWDETTGVLRGNARALDTNGASAWFEPSVSLTSLTFTFAQRAGFPIYQTWFSALEYNLTGTVTAPDGREQGISVRLFDPAGNRIGETTTDEAGRYAFSDFATYDGYRVQVVRPPGLTSDDPLTQIVDLSEGDQVADFVLREIVPVPVSGTVTDPDGNPVAGVTITLDPPGAGPVRTAVTQSDGTYVFGNVEPGEGYTLTATPPAGTTVSEDLRFTVPDDTEDPITEQDFVVTSNPTGTASGNVTEGDEGGPGRSGVRIDIVGPDDVRYSVVTNADGAWSLPDLPPGDYTATARPPFGTAVDGAASRDFTIPPTGGAVSDQDFVIDVLPTGTASGQVTEGDPGGPGLQGVRIDVVGPEGARYSVITNADGAWSLPDLPPGDYTATVVPLDGTGVVGNSSRDFTVAPTGGNVTGQDFVLAQTHSADGTVTDDEDQPLAGVDVVITDSTGATQTVTTDDDGAWSVDGLVPGDYTATVTVPDGYDPVGDTTLSFTVVDDDVTGLDFELVPLESAPSPSPSPTTTTGVPSPVPTVTETAVEVVSGGGSGSGSSGSGSAGSLASTGGPSLLIGLGGAALLLAGLVTLGVRRRGPRS
ncbi:MAG TPA: carboxypeptidase regulatory-like domain-containing protein [Microlunatus sp.]|nr:carboxypeptidase regulatory-like domain-containing protein [Microlunatus sp.]